MVLDRLEPAEVPGIVGARGAAALRVVDVGAGRAASEGAVALLIQPYADAYAVLLAVEGMPTYHWTVAVWWRQGKGVADAVRSDMAPERGSMMAEAERRARARAVIVDTMA